MKNVLLVIVVTLAYIGLLTTIFEYFINEVSSTALSATGLLLIVVLSACYLYFIIRRIKIRTP